MLETPLNFHRVWMQIQADSFELVREGRPTDKCRGQTEAWGNPNPEDISYPSVPMPPPWV
jgi:hypothetical protein